MEGKGEGRKGEGRGGRKVRCTKLVCTGLCVTLSCTVVGEGGERGSEGELEWRSRMGQEDGRV